jgi:predicted metal-dependent phosphoesterase TrpH
LGAGISGKITRRWILSLPELLELIDYRAELHVHTVLSPCADVAMIPPLIVETALEQGIHLIAITDHNATGNIQSVQKAAVGTALKVLSGMELQTREEVHVLCLFDTLEKALEFQAIVDAALPNIENNAEFFGEQFLVDETGDFITTEKRLLLTSANLGLEEACQVVHDLGGLFIPAHINRKAFGLIPVLGFVPPDLALDAVEISRYLKPDEISKKLPRAGDVHRLDEFLGNTHFVIANRSIAEIQLALQHQSNRDTSIQ